MGSMDVGASSAQQDDAEFQVGTRGGKFRKGGYGRKYQ